LHFDVHIYLKSIRHTAHCQYDTFDLLACYKNNADINETIFASTIMKTGGVVYCLKKKHYPIPGIVVDLS